MLFLHVDRIICRMKKDSDEEEEVYFDSHTHLLDYPEEKRF